MRRVVLAIASTVTALVLLLGFKTHSTTSPAAAAAPPAAVASPTTSASAGSTTSGSSTSGSSTSGSSTTSPSTTSPTTSTSPAATTSGTKTVTGNAADTRYGPVQVQITVTNGKVTAVTAVEYPNDNPRDQQINSYAVPQLNQEATAAKNAHIDTVSGATYTSNGYITSLQSALDQAGLA